jgi:hypothetical protein
MKREQVTEVVNSHPVISEIHDELFDSSISLAEAYNKACIAIYELSSQVSELQGNISAGYMRHNTSHLRWKSKTIPNPVDEGDAWVKGA